MTGQFAIRNAGFIGFDHILKELEQISTHAMDHYPPHNIVKYNEHELAIEIAVAGFSEEDLDIEYKDNELTIEGKKKEEEQSDYVHKGIANRGFKKVWHIEDHTEVIGAELKNGLLKVSLEKIVPDTCCCYII